MLKTFSKCLGSLVLCEQPRREEFGSQSRSLKVGSCQYVGNKQIEDRIAFGTSNKGIFFMTVLDGHGGFQLADHLSKRLPELFYEEKENDELFNMKEMFLRADSEWLDFVRPMYFAGFTGPIKVGACAVAVAIDTESIVVASVGDCRCVLASKDGKVADLSIERNANLESEQARLRLLHPGEEDVVKCKRSWQEEDTKGKWFTSKNIITKYSGCYVKGRLQPTKSFGDFHLKEEYVGFDPERNRPFLDPTTGKSFPYIDAIPDVSRRIRSKDDMFLIAATDGLWDQFSSEEAVKIVETALRSGRNPDQAAEDLIEAALVRAASNNQMSLLEMKLVPPGSNRRNLHDDISSLFVLPTVSSMVLSSVVTALGKASFSLHETLMPVKQSGFLCCWSFDDYMADGEVHAMRASQSFAHAAGISTNEDLKALASRAAQHTSTAQQLGAIASKES